MLLQVNVEILHSTNEASSSGHSQHHQLLMTE